MRRDSGVPRARSTFSSSIFQGLNEAAVTSCPGTYIELKPEAEKRLLLGTVTEKNMGNQPRQGTLVPCFISKQTVPKLAQLHAQAAAASLIPLRKGRELWSLPLEVTAPSSQASSSWDKPLTPRDLIR